MLPMFIMALKESPPALPTALRIHRVQGSAGIWEITFAADGRATFEYGEEIIAGEPHIIWRRIGHHDDQRSQQRGSRMVRQTIATCSAGCASAIWL